jgi:hypothetical protein
MCDAAGTAGTNKRTVGSLRASQHGESEDHWRKQIDGHQCFRGDFYEPPSMCGDCEQRALDAEYESEEFLFWDELEFERDRAFDVLVSTPAPVERDSGDAGS